MAPPLSFLVYFFHGCLLFGLKYRYSGKRMKMVRYSCLMRTCPWVASAQTCRSSQSERGRLYKLRKDLLVDNKRMEG